jgi:integrase
MAGVDLRFVDAYRKERTEEEAAPKTIYNETMIVRQLMNFAKSRRLQTSDRLAGLNLREPKPAPQPCWTQVEANRILATANPAHRAAFTILADKGLRIGELQHLTWDDQRASPAPQAGLETKDGGSTRYANERSRRAERPPTTVLMGAYCAAVAHLTRSGTIGCSERRLLKAQKQVLDELGFRGHLHTVRHAFISTR